MAKFVMEKQRLVFLAAVIVLGGENLSVARHLAIGVLLFFEQDPECIALARIRVEIQVVAKDLREAHGNFRGFTRLLDGIKK